jgi:hypothetical protein
MTFPSQEGEAGEPAVTADLSACPARCDGRHDADDQVAAFHARIVAERGGAAAVLSYASYHARARPAAAP